MLSRVADSLYWLGRYLERAEHTARLLDVNLNLTLDRTPESSGRHWVRLCESLQVEASDSAIGGAPALTARLILDPTQKESIAACITTARENARQIREQISSEMWEQVNRMYWQVKQTSPETLMSGQPQDALRAVIDGSYLFIGITNSTMNRGEGWHFIQLARFLERAMGTALLLDVHFRAFKDVRGGEVQAETAAEWAGLLRSCTALEAYGRRFTARLDARRVADFLLLDPDLPRSIRFAVEHVESSLRAITRLSGREDAGRPERLAGRLASGLHYAQLDEIMADSLQHFLESVRRQCAQIHTATYQTFISYQVQPALA
jgi:uncharacterized alpha-E superfamily protein